MTRVRLAIFVWSGVWALKAFDSVAMAFTVALVALSWFNYLAERTDGWRQQRRERR